MAHEFEVREEIQVEATPEQVWEAIATGPGVDSWLMGHTTMSAGLGGRNTLDMGGFTMESTITAWEPGRHLAFKGDPGPDGAIHAFEYLIEGRDGGSTVVRFVHSGFLGDDWENEYDALRKGDRVYLQKLGQYLKYFPGRVAAPIGGFGGQVADKAQAWRTIHAGLGLSGPVAVGEKVHLTPAGLEPLDGVVDLVNDDFLNVRTEDGIYVFIHGYQGAVVIGHHVFGEAGQPAPEIKQQAQAWRSWLSGLFA
jgi:uncharacterized protein YndB with AHSA1/START domain